MGVKEMALMTCLGSKCKQALWLVWAPAAARVTAADTGDHIDHIDMVQLFPMAYFI